MTSTANNRAPAFGGNGESTTKTPGKRQRREEPPTPVKTPPPSQIRLQPLREVPTNQPISPLAQLFSPSRDLLASPVHRQLASMSEAKKEKFQNYMGEVVKGHSIAATGLREQGASIQKCADLLVASFLNGNQNQENVAPSTMSSAAMMAPLMSPFSPNRSPSPFPSSAAPSFAPSPSTFSSARPPPGDLFMKFSYDGMSFCMKFNDVPGDRGDCCTICLLQGNSEGGAVAEARSQVASWLYGDKASYTPSYTRSCYFLWHHSQQVTGVWMEKEEIHLKCAELRKAAVSVEPGERYYGDEHLMLISLFKELRIFVLRDSPDGLAVVLDTLASLRRIHERIQPEEFARIECNLDAIAKKDPIVLYWHVCKAPTVYPKGEHYKPNHYGFLEQSPLKPGDRAYLGAGRFES